MAISKINSPTIHRLQHLDSHCFMWIQQHYQGKRSYPLVRLISITGDGWLYALMGLTLLAFNYGKYYEFFYSSLLAFSVEVPLYLILKKRFKRNRPAQHFSDFCSKISPSDEFSFPSGHTAAAFLMATQVLIFIPAFAAIALIWAAAIGLSRILLGVHFPGDIFAGVLLGSVSALLGSQLIALIISLTN